MIFRRYDVIIPTYNESKVIGSCLLAIRNAAAYFQKQLKEAYRQEGHWSDSITVTITDGGSVDGTLETCRRMSNASEPIEIVAQPKNGKIGRGAVLRRAANHILKRKNYEEQGDDDDFLVFVHADCIVPLTFFWDLHALRKNVECGFCRMDFGRRTIDFRILQWIASFDSPVTSFGDQSIIVRRKTYRQVGGMPDQKLCEDVEFFSKCRRSGARPQCLPINIRVSPRKFESRGVYLYMAQCCVICTMYHFGVGPDRLVRLYSDPTFLRPSSAWVLLLLFLVVCSPVYGLYVWTRGAVG